MFSIHISDDLHARLNALAERTGHPISHHVGEALEAHLSDMEDVFLAEQRLLNIQSGRSKLRSLDDVEKSLGDDAVRPLVNRRGGP